MLYTSPNCGNGEINSVTRVAVLAFVYNVQHRYWLLLSLVFLCSFTA